MGLGLLIITITLYSIFIYGKGRPFRLLQIILFEIFFLYFFLQRLGVPKNLEFIIDATIFLFFINCLRRKNRKLKHFDHIPIYLFFIGMLSWLFYERNIFSLLLTIRFLSRPLLIYYGLRFSNFNQKEINGIVKLIIRLIALQIPFVLLESLYGIPWGDKISGSLGDGKNQVLFLLMALLLGYITYKFIKNDISAFKYFLLVFLTFIPPIVASTIFYIIYTPTYILIIFIVKGKKIRQIYLLILLLIFVLVFPSLAKIHDQYRYRGRMEQNLHDINSVLSYGRYGTKSGAFGRTQTFFYVLDIVRDNFDVTILLGNGIGATKESRIPSWEGHIEKKYYDYKVARLFVSYLFFEFGLIGIFLLSQFLWYHYKISLKNNNLISYLILGIVISGFYQKIVGSVQPEIIFYIFLAFNESMVENKNMQKKV